MSAPPVIDAPSPFDASWRQEVGAGLDADGVALIDQAVTWAIPRFEGQHALTGEPLASHGAGVVRILAALHTDAATRAAALLAALPTDLMAPAPALRNDPVAAA
ncbi:HD domain-containing protein, partial [Achromobacter sp. AGC39]